MLKRSTQKSRRREPVAHSLLDTEELFKTVGEEPPARRIHRSVVRINTHKGIEAAAQQLRKGKRVLERELKEASQQVHALQETNRRLADSLQQVNELTEALQTELEEAHSAMHQLKCQSEEQQDILQTQLQQVQQAAQVQAHTHSAAFAQFRTQVTTVLEPLLQFTRWTIATARAPAFAEEIAAKARALHRPLAVAEQLLRTDVPVPTWLVDADLLACLQCQASLLEGVVTQC